MGRYKFNKYLGFSIITVLLTSGCQHPEPVIRLADLSYKQLVASKLSAGASLRQLQDSRQSFADSISIQSLGAESLSEQTQIITRDWADAGLKQNLALLDRMKIDDQVILDDPYAPFRKAQQQPISKVSVDLKGLNTAISGVDKLRSDSQDWSADEAFDFSKILVEEAIKEFSSDSSKQ
jgi:hypothetical protein